jgi:hypothetical protein
MTEEVASFVVTQESRVERAVLTIPMGGGFSFGIELNGMVLTHPDGRKALERCAHLMNLGLAAEKDKP